MEIILYVKTTWNCQTDEYLKQYDKRQTWSAIDVEHSRGALKKRQLRTADYGLGCQFKNMISIINSLNKQDVLTQIKTFIVFHL